MIGRPLTALPDHLHQEQPITLLRRWQLCQNVINHFWKKWSTEYITKWFHRSRNVSVGDVIILHDETLLPTNWLLARVIKVHPGKDNLV